MIILCSILHDIRIVLKTNSNCVTIVTARVFPWKQILTCFHGDVLVDIVINFNCLFVGKVLQEDLVDAANNAQNEGRRLAALDDPTASTAGVEDQLKALNDRVSKIKGKISAYEEHYQDHLKQALEFQDAVRKLLEKVLARKEKLDETKLDTKNKDAILARIAELEVNNIQLNYFSYR